MAEPAPSDSSSRAERFRRVMALFEELLPVPPLERAARLAASEADPSVRLEVEAMLAIDAGTSSELMPGAGLDMVLDLARRREQDGADLASGRLPVLRGQYRIVRQIGEGGMGVVYEAEQAVPRRRVALKAVRAGFDSARVLRRFEQEAHILGRLQHPGIAQIHEAGSSEGSGSGQAFIAMEYVEGRPLGEWARDKSDRERVELLVQMCDAVHHAHLRRVIHRDLKPGNVLVDAGGRAKILDFGVARFADAETGVESLHTREGQLVGTLPYMSPEQVGGASPDVDARTDVYALGVILYELLSGRLPHPIGDRTLPRQLLAIRDEEPPRLGTLVPRLRGDLEAITARALAKDRERRYQSAAELGLDLQRWLDGEAVLARQDSGLYVASRWVARHKALSAAVVVALVSLLAFAVTAKLAQRRADRDAIVLAQALRSSRIERGRLLGLSNNLPGAEKLLWDEYLAAPSTHAHWALWEVYSRFPCARSLVGHTDSILDMAMAPDGSRLATGSHDRTVRVWDWNSGTVTDTLPVSGFLTGLTFGGDGRRLFTSELDGTVMAFDTTDHHELWRRRLGPETGMRSLADVAATRTADTIAVVGEGTDVVLLRASDGGLLSRIPTSAPILNTAACDDRGRRVVAGGMDGSVHVLDVSVGREEFQTAATGDPVRAVCFDPTYRWVAFGTDHGVITVLDVATHRELSRFESDVSIVRSVGFSRDGRRLISSYSNGIDLWRVGSDGVLGDRRRLEQPAFAAEFDADSSHFVTGEPTGTLRVWDLDPEPGMRTLEPPDPDCSQHALLRHGTLEVTRRNSGQIDFFDFETRARTGQLTAVPGGLVYLACDDEAHWVAVAVDGGRVGVWNADTGAQSFLQQLDAEPACLRFAPGGDVLVVALEDGSLRFIGARDGVQLAKINADGPVADKLCFSRDGRFLASGHRGRRLRIWDASTRALVQDVETGRGIASLQFDADDSRLFVGTWDGRVQIRTFGTGTLLRTLEGHALQVYGIVLVPGSSLFLTYSADGTVRLWDPDVEECLVKLDPHSGACRNTAVTRDGRYVRAAYDDGRVREWDLKRYDREIAGNEAAQRALRGLPSGTTQR